MRSGGGILPNKQAQNSPDENKKPDSKKQGISNRNLAEEDARQAKVIPFPSERREGRKEGNREEEEEK